MDSQLIIELEKGRIGPPLRNFYLFLIYLFSDKNYLGTKYHQSLAPRPLKNNLFIP